LTRNAGTTLTFKNEAIIMRYVNKLHEELVDSLTESIGAENFTTLMFFPTNTV